MRSLPRAVGPTITLATAPVALFTALAAVDHAGVWPWWMPWVIATVYTAATTAWIPRPFLRLGADVERATLRTACVGRWALDREDGTLITGRLVVDNPVDASRFAHEVMIEMNALTGSSEVSPMASRSHDEPSGRPGSE